MNLVDRIKNIMPPEGKWPIIAGEETNAQALYTGYIMILAAIGPLAMLIRSMAVGAIGTIVAYIISLIMVYVVALIVDALAPTFGGEKNFMQSLKLVAYSSTAAWLAGIFQSAGCPGRTPAPDRPPLLAVHLLSRRIGDEEVSAGQGHGLYGRRRGSS